MNKWYDSRRLLISRRRLFTLYLVERFMALPNSDPGTPPALALPPLCAPFVIVENDLKLLPPTVYDKIAQRSSRSEERRCVVLLAIQPRQDLLVSRDEAHACFLGGTVAWAEEQQVRLAFAIGCQGGELLPGCGLAS